MNGSENYRVEEKQEGRSGHAYYIEQGRLPFFYEILGIKGRGLDIPSPEQWDAYCEKHEAEWAKGRRDEILERVAQALLKKWYRHGTYEIIEDRSLNIYPDPSLLSRLLDKLG
jgi:hypothetical protein